MTAPPVQLRHVGTTPDGIDLWACVVCQRPSTRDKAPNGRRHHRGLPRINGHGKCGACYVAARRRTHPERSPAMPVPATNTEAGDWRSQAACKDADVDLFFPIGHDWRAPAMKVRATQAKAICADCPVRTSCLAHAITEGDDVGIFGGLTPAERRRLAFTRNGRAKAAA